MGDKKETPHKARAIQAQRATQRVALVPVRYSVLSISPVIGNTGLLCLTNKCLITGTLNGNMNGHDIIVIGASAGGVEALAQVASDLPADLAAAVFIVLHVPAHGISVLPAILSRRGVLPATHPADGEPIRSGHIYIAPPDHHLLVKHGYMRVVRGPTENGHRPSVDPLFRSAARFYGPRVIGVILSGTLDDGTSGLLTVKRRGGLAVVQDPEEALFAGMPRSAVENVAVDWVVPLADVGPTLARLARESAPGSAEAASAELEAEVDIAEMDMGAIEAPRAGAPSGFTCPDCHGALWEVQEGDLTRFRCRVGHAYSPDSLLAEQSEALEEALWIAMRALEESAALADRMAERAQERGHALAATRFGEQAQDARQRAAIIRRALIKGQNIAPDTPVAAQERESSLNPNPAGKLAMDA